jgi:hypothetical protein
LESLAELQGQGPRLAALHQVGIPNPSIVCEFVVVALLPLKPRTQLLL